MTSQNNSDNNKTSSPNPEIVTQSRSPLDLDDFQDNDTSNENLATQQALAAIAAINAQQQSSSASNLIVKRTSWRTAHPRASLLTLVAIALICVGLYLNNFLWIGWVGTLLALLLSLGVLLPWTIKAVSDIFSPLERSLFVAGTGLTIALIGLFRFGNIGRAIIDWATKLNWDAIGALGEVFGALGQILIAVIAVYVAWRQYVISKDLTIQQNLLTVQQNLITQQQTIDSYFQGISDLVLDEEGMLEDWPQERAIAEGRTAAIFSSVDASGKAKIIRFLSQSKLLTPLQRDFRLGRAILNGEGGYSEDRNYGIRVIDLGVMLARADLSKTDLRWTDLSEANLIGADLTNCDLVKANFSRTILYEAQLVSADLRSTRLFYGDAQTATPRSRNIAPNYNTGEQTGAVIENADFTDAQRMSESSRYYCCAWGGEKTRATIPGGCEGIPNKLGR
ncbi:low-complexity protein [Chroococcidiopsis sp. CCALA 051]|uniref:pentapeptide repeat-containing protein n=1 Tax=Chroococcidiopsis sp. CCALA 051 TaxID=869949 RepID=UPI000D0DA450|nr:pentapeptide repeat-containing protein [Chroococcidiopsis sp. CCALA 051]MBE9020214.1 pentapeptide repeat-containing protein [Chroococcidiopsidales cyanobacterium LEGE 13417]PSM46925.1 low-complexity protein [Chroococcidiopsis sp. CCALA 051]